MGDINTIHIFLLLTAFFASFISLLVYLGKPAKYKNFKATKIPNVSGTIVTTDMMTGFAWNVSYNQSNPGHLRNQELLLVEELDDPREDDGTPILVPDHIEEGGCGVPYESAQAKSLIERHDTALKTIEQLRLILDDKDELIKLMKKSLKDKKIATFVDRKTVKGKIDTVPTLPSIQLTSGPQMSGFLYIDGVKHEFPVWPAQTFAANTTLHLDIDDDGDNVYWNIKENPDAPPMT